MTDDTSCHRFRFAWLLPLLLLAALPSTARADYRAGASAFEKGEFAMALKYWRPLAEAGDAKGQFGLGVLYDEGRGLAEDRRQAAFWFAKAAEQGHASAQHNLAQLHLAGDGMPPDPSLARRWLERAAA